MTPDDVRSLLGLGLFYAMLVTAFAMLWAASWQ